MKYIDDYEICPVCGHDWSAHFGFLDEEGEYLSEPKAYECMECHEPMCTFALFEERGSTP